VLGRLTLDVSAWSCGCGPWPAAVVEPAEPSKVPRAPELEFGPKVVPVPGGGPLRLDWPWEVDIVGG
jgi:hypothetical protein